MILYKICRGKLTNNNHWIQLFDLVQTILEHILSICIKMLQSLNIFVQVFFNSNGFANNKYSNGKKNQLSDLLLYFLEKKFNLTQEFCANIEDYRNTTAYDDVEQEVKYFKHLAQIF